MRVSCCSPQQHEHLDFLRIVPFPNQECTPSLPLKGAIEQDHDPAGYNIGINLHQAGGQTVFHLHVPLIPRYEGDVPESAGVTPPQLLAGIILGMI